ncbi:hypothetical protein Pyn_15260 [Prunus yedoensis var. nudiflora]|uniref:Uncharacterized protein n=1 Tax=Prunus yedoensis var. nudiflora TaxID=2094558 RepID=A0A314V170_PRUYE|nr:hypothetical protein Pyn_15260 [Prunus yedoensis var. nudiflora]
MREKWGGPSPARAIVATSQLAVEVRDRIEENETEKKLFDRLRLGTARLAISAPGGWVRDQSENVIKPNIWGWELRGWKLSFEN